MTEMQKEVAVTTKTTRSGNRTREQGLSISKRVARAIQAVVDSRNSRIPQRGDDL